jgi:hypothetical protein
MCIVTKLDKTVNMASCPSDESAKPAESRSNWGQGATLEAWAGPGDTSRQCDGKREPRVVGSKGRLAAARNQEAREGSRSNLVSQSLTAMNHAVKAACRIYATVLVGRLI